MSLKQGATSLTLQQLLEDPLAALSGLQDGTSLLVTDDGKPLVVLLSPDTHRRRDRELQLLRRLALGELECAAGDGHPQEEVLDDCDLLLEEC